MRTLEQIIPGEKAKASKALRTLPVMVRGFYEPQYGTGIGNTAGEFLGLTCKLCDRWEEYGHSKDCPVKKVK